MISRTNAYKGKYRFDSLTIVSIPINGLENSYSISIVAPTNFDDGVSIKAMCP